MEQSPSGKPNRFSAIREILRILWNREVHYYVCKALLFVPVLSQINPICPSIPFPEDPSQYYPPIYALKCHKIRNKFRINRSNIEKS
jgi:hypothetical protein